MESLPILVQMGGVPFALVAMALIAGASGLWVYGPMHRSVVAEKDKEIARLVSERDASLTRIVADKDDVIARERERGDRWEAMWRAAVERLEYSLDLSGAPRMVAPPVRSPVRERAASRKEVGG